MTTKVTVSHNQTIDGKDYKPGQTADIDDALARTLINRGAVRLKADDTKKSATTNKKETSK